MLGVFSGLTLDILAKYLLEEYSLPQFIFARSLFALIIFCLITPWYGGLESIKTKQWKWHFLRAILSIIAMFGFFYGITLMPLVNALTLAYIAPLIVTALSSKLLNEKVGWRRWTAGLIGFIGVLVILRPGSGMFSLASISVLAAAFSYALLAITARKLTDSESTIAMSAWVIFFLAGLFSVGTWIGFINAYKKSSPVILAPFEYIGLIGAAFAGYWIWQEIPDEFVILGALIIVCSGLFVAYREMDKSIPALYLRGFRTTGTNLIKKKLKRKETL